MLKTDTMISDSGMTSEPHERLIAIVSRSWSPYGMLKVGLHVGGKVLVKDVANLRSSLQMHL